MSCIILPQTQINTLTRSSGNLVRKIVAPRHHLIFTPFSSAFPHYLPFHLLKRNTAGTGVPDSPWDPTASQSHHSRRYSLKIHSPPAGRTRTPPPPAGRTSAAAASLLHGLTPKASAPRAAPGRALLALPTCFDPFSGLSTSPAASHVDDFRLQPSAPSAVHSTASPPKFAISDSACAGGTH